MDPVSQRTGRWCPSHSFEICAIFWLWWWWCSHCTPCQLPSWWQHILHVMLTVTVWPRNVLPPLLYCSRYMISLSPTPDWVVEDASMSLHTQLVLLWWYTLMSLSQYFCSWLCRWPGLRSSSGEVCALWYCPDQSCAHTRHVQLSTCTSEYLPPLLCKAKTH